MFIKLNGTYGREIVLNINSIASVTEEGTHPHVNTIVTMTDGKRITVSCGVAEVHAKINERMRNTKRSD